MSYERSVRKLRLLQSSCTLDAFGKIQWKLSIAAAMNLNHVFLLVFNMLDREVSLEEQKRQSLSQSQKRVTSHIVNITTAINITIASMIVPNERNRPFRNPKTSHPLLVHLSEPSTSVNALLRLSKSTNRASYLNPDSKSTILFQSLFASRISISRSKRPSDRIWHSPNLPSIHLLRFPVSPSIGTLPSAYPRDAATLVMHL